MILIHGTCHQIPTMDPTKILSSTLVDSTTFKSEFYAYNAASGDFGDYSCTATYLDGDTLDSSSAMLIPVCKYLHIPTVLSFVNPFLCFKTQIKTLFIYFLFFNTQQTKRKNRKKKTIFFRFYHTRYSQRLACRTSTVLSARALR